MRSFGPTEQQLAAADLQRERGDARYEPSSDYYTWDMIPADLRARMGGDGHAHDCMHDFGAGCSKECKEVWVEIRKANGRPQP